MDMTDHLRSSPEHSVPEKCDVLGAILELDPPIEDHWLLRRAVQTACDI
jgi:hypothetical protein